MSSSIPLSEMESSPAAKWDAGPGTTYAGRIIAIDQRRQTDPATGQGRNFPSGEAMMVWVITIEQANGDAVALWASGGSYTPASGTGKSMMSAIGDAVRAAGASAVDIGAQLAVAHTGMGQPTSPGKNPPRLFTAQYKPGAPAGIPASDLFGS